MSDAVLQSPLAPLLGAGDTSLMVDGQAVTLGDAPLMDMLNLRGNPADAMPGSRLPRRSAPRNDGVTSLWGRSQS